MWVGTGGGVQPFILRSLSYVYDDAPKYTHYKVYPKIYSMPRRGINYKKALLSLDRECWQILASKKESWPDFNASAHVRRAIKAYEKAKYQKPDPSEWDGVDVIYD